MLSGITKFSFVSLFFSLFSPSFPFFHFFSTYLWSYRTYAHAQTSKFTYSLVLNTHPKQLFPPFHFVIRIFFKKWVDKMRISINKDYSYFLFGNIRLYKCVLVSLFVSQSPPITYESLYRYVIIVTIVLYCIMVFRLEHHMFKNRIFT